MIACKLMWLPEPNEPWPPIGVSPWREQLVELLAVPRRKEYIRFGGDSWEVIAVVWEVGKPVEVRLTRERH